VPSQGLRIGRPSSCCGRTYTRTPPVRVCSVLIDSSHGPAATVLMASTAFSRRRSHSTGSHASPRRVWTATPFVVTALCANPITSPMRACAISSPVGIYALQICYCWQAAPRPDSLAKFGPRARNQVFRIAASGRPGTSRGIPLTMARGFLFAPGQSGSRRRSCLSCSIYRLWRFRNQPRATLAGQIRPQPLRLNPPAVLKLG
jgi:hypothetical protein